ncbi:MAG: arsenate reductase (glutaredoxin) [Roseivivax sp.]|nr:arsenate reductase (glutaredoxin) [Roseivivax sp.]
MIVVWHNPRCSKSRAAVARLEAAGVPFSVRLYLVDAPSLEELRAAQRALGVPALAMVRAGEPLFAELGLSLEMDDAALLSAMAAHPRLIERPVVFNGARAVIGRPTEAIDAVL